MLKNLENSKFGLSVDKFDIITFDVFDTAIVRPVIRPVDMFYILTIQQREELLRLNINFEKSRIESESLLRNKINAQGLRIDPSLTEIYNEIARGTGLSKSSILFLQKAEESLEVSYTYRNELVYSMYKFAKSKNKIVAFITDTYFSENIIRKMLSKAGYDSNDKIFCSSNLKATKKHGELFKLVRDFYKEKKIIHVGDNRHSDCEMSKPYGISSLHYRKSIDYFFEDSSPAKKIWRVQPDQSIAQSALIALLSNKANRYNFDRESPKSLYRNDIYLLGYMLIGPFLFELVRWMIEEAKSRSIDNILFLARDGYLPLLALEQFHKNSSVSVKGIYIPISRKVLIPFRILSHEGIEALFQLPVGDQMSVEDFFRERLLADLIPEISMLRDSLRHANDQPFTQWREEIRDQLLKRSYSIRSACEDLKENALFYYRNHIPNQSLGLFDVGSKGSFQRFFEKEMNIKAFGFYVTTSPSAERNLGLQNFATFYHHTNSTLDLKRLDTQFFESILSATSGSTIGFDRNASPVYAPSKSSASYADLKRLQKGAIDFVADLTLRFKDFACSMKLDLDNFHAQIESILRTKSDSSLFSNITHDDPMYSQTQRSIHEYYFSHSIDESNNHSRLDKENRPIVIYCPAFTRVRGGVERIVSYIANDLHQRGRKVHILTSGDEREYFIRPVYRVSSDISIQNINTSSEESIRSALVRLNPSCLLVMASGPVNKIFVKIALAIKLPIALCERADPSSSLEYYWRKHSKNDFVETYSRANLISLQLKSFTEFFPQNLINKIRIHPNPVPDPGLDTHRERENLIVCVGRIFFLQKRQDILIEAFSKIINNYPDVKLEFYGKDQDGDLKNLLDLISRKGLEKNVSYRGVVDNIFEVFSRAKILVMPSRYEGFPNALAEGLAAGVPAIGFASCPGVNELIKHGENGLLSSDSADDLSSTIIEMLSNDTDWRRMSEAATKISKEYEIDNCLSLWRSFILDLEREFINKY